MSSDRRGEVRALVYDPAHRPRKVGGWREDASSQGRVGPGAADDVLDWRLGRGEFDFICARPVISLWEGT